MGFFTPVVGKLAIKLGASLGFGVNVIREISVI
jgi:hypothetical protein